MGMTTPRPAGTVAAASFGDLVCGLASTTPPQPFVGELGAATDTAAQGVVGGLLRAAGAPLRSRPKVTIGGRTLGTIEEVVRSIPASPTPGMARMWTGSAIARVAGSPVTLQGGPAHITPLSALADLGGGQTLVRLRGAAQTVDPPEGEGLGGLGMGLADARRSVPPRVSFDVTSELHRMVSQCSAARRLDLAPIAYEVLVGDPVDVVTGSVVTRATDFEQPWPRVRLRRRYDSRRSGRCSPFGHGWSHELDQALWLEPGRVVVRDGDGREHEFSTLGLPDRTCRPGDVLFDAPRRQRLRCTGAGQWELSDGRSLRQFAAPDPGSTRGLVYLSRLALRDGSMIECTYAPLRGAAGASRFAEPPRGAAAPAGASAASHEGLLLVEVRVDGSPLLRFEHDGTGLVRRVCSVTAEGELVEASYQYSPARDLVQVTDAEGRTQGYAYRGHLLVQEQTRDGGRFCYGYDGVGPRARCVRAWGTGGFLDRALEHDPGGGRTIVRDGLGHETIYRYDAAGLVTEVEAPDGERVGYRYDDRLRLVEVAWPDGSRATAAYDDAGNLVRRSERDGATWTMTYDARGHLLQGTDPQGGTWRFHHDERGRLRELQDPAGNVTHLQFERGSCRVLDATGHGLHVGLDGQDRVTELPRPEGGRVRFAYDHRGRLAAAWSSGDAPAPAPTPRAARDQAQSQRQSQHQSQHQSQWRWDRANRLVRYEGPGTRIAWRRTGEGEVAAIEHGSGAVRIDRDAFGTIQAIDTGARKVTYTHDREGRLQSVAQDGQPLLTLEHGADGRVRGFVARDLPSGEVRRQGGRIVALRLGDDRIELEHDAAGRITTIARGEGRRSTFAYRPDGQLVAATNEHVACAFERDPRGAVLEQRWGDVVLGDATPDHRGRRGGLRVPRRGRISYLRSREGAVERIAVFAGADQGPRAWLEPHELSPTPSSESDAMPVPTFEVAATDALGRPISSRGPAHVVWDEDRCVAVGDVLLVHHPDEGEPLYAIDGEGRVRPLAHGRGSAAGSAPAGRRPADGSPLDRMLAAAFPSVAPPSVEASTPTALLAGLLGHRAWIPQIRPIPGQGPWDPDVWGPRVDAPEPEVGRLDAVALLRALGSPFPRPELEIRSVDRRLPPPEPLP